MFERFTDRARKVMALANQEAQRFNHSYIDIEHILLGLIKEGSGNGVKVLRILGLDPKALYIELKNQIESGEVKINMGKLPQTPSAKHVIEYAIEETRLLNINYVGTENILLGLLREEEGIASKILREHGVELNNARKEVLKLTKEGQDDKLKMLEFMQKEEQLQNHLRAKNSGIQKSSTGKEEKNFYDAYVGLSRNLRVWFIAYGIGGPVLFLSNNEVWQKISASEEGKLICFLFLSGVSIQLIGTLLYKTAMWYLYTGELHKDFKKRFRYKVSDFLSECYCLEFLFDLGTLITFGWATYKVFRVLTS